MGINSSADLGLEARGRLSQASLYLPSSNTLLLAQCEKSRGLGLAPRITENHPLIGQTNQIFSICNIRTGDSGLRRCRQTKTDRIVSASHFQKVNGFATTQNDSNGRSFNIIAIEFVCSRGFIPIPAGHVC